MYDGTHESQSLWLATMYLRRKRVSFEGHFSWFLALGPFLAPKSGTGAAFVPDFMPIFSFTLFATVFLSSLGLI